MLIGDEIVWIIISDVSAPDFSKLNRSKPTLRFFNLPLAVTSWEIYNYLKTAGVTSVFIPTLRSEKWFRFALISFNSEEESNTLLREDFSIGSYNFTISELTTIACKFCYKIDHLVNDCPEKKESKNNRFNHQRNFENMKRFYWKY